MRVVFLALLLFAASVPALAQPSMNPVAWTFEHSVGITPHPITHGSGWRFVFPTGTNDVDYLTTPVGSFQGGRSIIIAGKIAANPSVRFVGSDQDGGTAAPAFRLYIQAQGDQCLCNDFGRWWSSPQKVDLKSGKFRMVVALRPGAWQSVFGHKGDSSPAARVGFAKALANPARVGMTFGCCNNFGHGVRTRNGYATMVVTQYKINQVSLSRGKTQPR